MKPVLRFVGIAFLVVATVVVYLEGVVIPSFRGDQIVAAYATQLGSVVLLGILIGAVVTHVRHRSMRPWILSYAALAAAIILASVVSWHVIDDRECPAYPTTPDGCFNPQLR